MAPEPAGHGDVHGDRGGVAAGRDVVAHLISTGDHATFFAGGYQALSDAYIDNWSVFERVRVDQFVGRAWLASEVDRFIGAHDRGYFVLEAQAGLGKSAFLAHLVRRRGWINHFVELAPGESGVVPGRLNLAAQVMRAFELDPATALPDAAARPDFLASLLRKAAAGLAAGEKLVVVVDGLDEAGTRIGENVLGLPPVLPAGVFFVVSQRPAPVTLDVESPRRVFALDAASEENIDDVRAYLRGTGRSEQFVDSLVTKSRGLWIYLHHVLDEMARGQQFDPENLPDGLWRYYSRFWRRWRERHSDSWYAVDLPLLSSLAAVREDVSPDLLGDLSAVPKGPRVEALLREKWRPFIAFQRGPRPTFRLYHRSLEDFLHGRVDEDDLTDDEAAFADEVAAATRSAHERIAGRYLSAWGGLEAGLPELTDPGVRTMDGGYGLRHLAAHLAEAGATATLYALIGKAWMEAQFAWSSSPDAFARDVEIAIRAAQAEEPPNHLQEARCSLIYAGLGSMATKTPPEVLGALARLGQSSRAIGYARLIHDSERRSAAYLRIAQSINRAAKPEARRLLSQALEAALAVPWSPDRVDVLARLGQGALEMGETAFAEKTADHLVAAAELDWIAPRKARGLTTAAEIYVDAGQPEKALHVVDAALARVEDETERRWQAASVKVAIAITMDRAGRPEAAQQLVDTAAEVLTEQTADQYIAGEDHTRLVKDIARLGDLETARTWADALWGWYLPWSRIELASAYRRMGDREQAEQAIDAAMATARSLAAEDRSAYTWMKDQKQECLRAVAEACADAGRFDDAEEWARLIDYPDERAAALGNVATRLLTADRPRPARAAALIDEAMKVAQRQGTDAAEIRDRTLRRRDTVLRMVQIAAGRGDFAEARTHVALLAVKADRVPALGDISAAHLAAGDPDSARRAAREALELAELIGAADFEEGTAGAEVWGMTGPQAKAEEARGAALLSASRALLRAAPGDEALAACRRAVAVVNLMRDPNVWRRLIDEALANLAEAGGGEVTTLLEKAREKYPSEDPEGVSAVAAGAAKGGNIDLALELIRDPADRSTDGRLIALAAIVESVARTGDRARAAAIAEDAFAAAATVESLWERAKAFGALARATSAAGLPTVARRAADEAVRAADTLCDTDPMRER